MKRLSILSGAAAGWVLIVAGTALPLLAQEEHGSDPAATPTGMLFRWLNFALVFGGLAYLIRKFGLPYFRGHAAAIGGSIRDAAEARAAAERQLREAEERLARLEGEIEELRRAAREESAREAERIRALARTETEKIARAARAEIESAERAARQELRAIAARVAIERAAELVRARLDPAAEAALFRSFVAELEKSAP